MVLKDVMKKQMTISAMAAFAALGLLCLAFTTAQAKKVDVLMHEQAVRQHHNFSQQNVGFSESKIIVAQGAKRVISPTQAVRAAMGSSPGGQALGVRYNSSRGGYVVRIRVGGRLLKLFVNGRTGRVAR